jgi:hypothetical protein
VSRRILGFWHVPCNETKTLQVDILWTDFGSIFAVGELAYENIAAANRCGQDHKVP